MKVMTSVPKPPMFDPAAWPDSPRPPYGYTGLRVGFDVVAEMVEPGGDETVFILGVAVPAVNIQLDPPKSERNHPVYFEATGRRFHYVISIWCDRVEIQIFDLPAEGPESGPFINARFPATETELLLAFQVIVADCSN